MEKEGKYIYCIIGTKQERNFGPIGIGGRGDEVLTINYDDMSMVVSSCPLTKFVVSSENMLAHMRVIEKVMNEFDSVLPVRFDTVASNADEIRNLLDKRLREFMILLKNMDHKVELGVKGLWKNMNAIFEEIVEENREIKEAKDKIQNEAGGENIQAKMKVGKMVKEALKKKKDQEAEKIVDALRRSVFEYKLNKVSSDEMFVNAAFLVDKGWEKEFDNIIEDLSEEHRDRVKFMYAGPMPVYNFVNIVVYPEEWEK
jgi:hypothetical protein